MNTKWTGIISLGNRSDGGVEPEVRLENRCGGNVTEGFESQPLRFLQFMRFATRTAF
jgi:hypothetical protein